MTIQNYLVRLKDKPKFYILFCKDAELRPIYITKFVEAHGGKPVYRDSMDIGKQPRQIGPKPVYIVVDWDTALKKPHRRIMNVSYPVLLVYTNKDEPSEAVQEAYKDHIVVVPPVTGEQASNLMRKQGVPDPVIDYLKEKTSSAQEAILLSKQLVELSEDLSLPIPECFERYFKKALVSRNIDEEPTEFLNALLTRQYGVAFSYTATQVGNELFVFAAVLNWLEDIIRFCSCNGDYWNDAGLVAAKYKPFKQYGVSRIPFIKYIKLYELGLRLMQSIKINEPNPSIALEVFLCHIMQTLG